MREGCLIGCLGIIAVAMILAIVVVAILDGFFGLFREADRVDLVEYYGADHPVLVLVEPEADLVGTVAREATGGSAWFVDYILPYEAALFSDVDTESGDHTITLAASMKRAAGLLSWYLPRGEGIDVFNGATIQDLGVQSNGVAFMKAHAPVEKDTLAHAQATPRPEDVVPYELERGHLCEIILNNAGGKAFVALDHLLTGGVRRVSEADKMLSAEEENLLSQNLTAARLVFDSAGPEQVKYLARVRLLDLSKAQELAPLTDRALRAVVQTQPDPNVTLDGGVRIEGEEIVGEYIIDAVHRPLANHWQKIVDDVERHGGR